MAEYSLDTSRVDWGTEQCVGGRRAMRSMGGPALEGLWYPSTHALCAHNELAAIMTRVMAPLPPQVFRPVGPAVRRAFQCVARLGGLYSGETWSYLQTAKSYSGRLGRRYDEAERSLRVDGALRREDWYLRPFLKAEKGNCVIKRVKPRLIYPRSPRYNLMLASRLKPFEHWVWARLTARWVCRGGVGRVCAKGLNPVQRASLIARKMSNLVDCRVMEVDGKAFEAHVGPDQIALEHAVYHAAFPGDGRLRELLRKQQVLEGTLPCGAKFSRPGARASGDYNTGLGNSLVMIATVTGVLRTYGIPFDVLVDGDNALLFLRACDLGRVVLNLYGDVVAQCGQELTLERPTSVLEEVRFGRSAPVYVAGKYRMVRDWRAVLSGALSSHRWLTEPRFVSEWVRGVAACELSLARGEPIVQQWALSLQAVWGGPGGVREHPHTDLVFKGAWFAASDEAVEVSMESRLSFERAFGVSPEEQLSIEKRVGAMVAQGPWHRVSLTGFAHDDADPGIIETYIDSF
jgi:hypothetical protein